MSESKNTPNWFADYSELKAFGAAVAEILDGNPDGAHLLQQVYDKPHNWTAEYLLWKAKSPDWYKAGEPATAGIFRVCNPLPEVNPPGLAGIQDDDDEFDGRTPADR
jgi:hypothetical protein